MKNSRKRSLKIVWIGIQAVLCIIQVTLSASISWGPFSRNVPSFIFVKNLVKILDIEYFFKFITLFLKKR